MSVVKEQLAINPNKRLLLLKRFRFRCPPNISTQSLDSSDSKSYNIRMHHEANDEIASFELFPRKIFTIKGIFRLPLRGKLSDSSALAWTNSLFRETYIRRCSSKIGTRGRRSTLVFSVGCRECPLGFAFRLVFALSMCATTCVYDSRSCALLSSLHLQVNGGKEYENYKFQA